MKDNYQFIETIGQGAFGQVNLVKSLKNGQIYAMKHIIRKDLPDSELFVLKNEIEILKELTHPNLVSIYEYYITKQSIYIVQERLEGGELFDYIVKHKGITEQEAANIIVQVLQAVNYCHNNNVMHRDLKPENIMLEQQDSNTNEQPVTIKLIDFGAARVFNKNQ